MLNGGYNNTVDDKGRLSFPAGLRNGFSGSTLVITRGIDRCLWAYPEELWQSFAEKWESASPMLKDVRRMQRHFLGWACEAEIDKSSRLAIPQSLREYASITRNCTILGVGQRIEIWDADTYKLINEGEDDAGIALAAEQFAEMF
ncbi:MAG: division/cell wall cluster transcriptional repressor MraZ [Termitinemataceae bacterium]|nr:MAG: division/cell wall cluster transcriptional repressor MraZ [Termitinemataceae bacterium]